MSREVALAFWDRAQEALASAQANLAMSKATAVSRAYYAAYYAVSAWFSLAGKTFKSHHMLEAAVHRDLVKTGRVPPELGREVLHADAASASRGLLSLSKGH